MVAGAYPNTATEPHLHDFMHHCFAPHSINPDWRRAAQDSELWSTTVNAYRAAIKTKASHTFDDIQSCMT